MTDEDGPDDLAPLGGRPQQFAGLPDPELLRQYRDIDPRIVDDLRAAVNEERTHRHDMERGDQAVQRLGLILAFTVVLAFLVASVYLGRSGQPVQGTIVGTTDLVAITTVFIYGSVTRRSRG